MMILVTLYRWNMFQPFHLSLLYPFSHFSFFIIYLNCVFLCFICFNDISSASKKNTISTTLTRRLVISFSSPPHGKMPKNIQILNFFLKSSSCSLDEFSSFLFSLIHKPNPRIHRKYPLSLCLSNSIDSAKLSERRRHKKNHPPFVACFKFIIGRNRMTMEKQQKERERRKNRKFSSSSIFLLRLSSLRVLLHHPIILRLSPIDYKNNFSTTFNFSLLSFFLPPLICIFLPQLALPYPHELNFRFVSPFFRDVHALASFEMWKISSTSFFFLSLFLFDITRAHPRALLHMS